MSSSEDNADLLAGAPLSRAVQLVGRLTWLYGIYTAVIGFLLLAGSAPLRGSLRMVGLAREMVKGGLGVTSLLAVLVPLIALCAAGLLTHSRLWRRRTEAALAAGEIDHAPPTLLAIVWKRGPGFLARQGQAILLPLGLAIMALVSWLIWPSTHAAAPVANDVNLIAALIIGLSFPSLIAERMMNGFPAAQMPEAPGLRRILLITTVALALAGLAEIGRGIGFTWTVWVQRALSVVSLLVAAEMAVRALARLFLPAPPAETATAATDSFIATLLTAGPRSPGNLIRTHLGLDFARSWALQFLAAAALPALTATLLVCWGLSGVKLLAADQRGVYERFGAPVAVLQPGFHLLLPWPLGQLRPVEYGTIHTIATGVEKGAEAFDATERAVKVGAESTQTASLNRLWETTHATEAEYLVASAAEGQQNFQMVNTEILVLYRTGMTNVAAMQAVYGSADQATIVQEEADRLALLYFSSHTLDAVLGAERETLQDTLRAELASKVNADKIGVEIVAVLINEVHPPAGAAGAYHHVQSAEIDAHTSAFHAQARAVRAAGQAQQESHHAATNAEAMAVEKMQGATADAYQFTADRKAYQASPGAFLLERRARMVEGLSNRRMMILDHGLSPSQIPLIDTRGAAAVSGGGVPAGAGRPYVPDRPPATSSEGGSPASTSEQAGAEND